MAKICASSSTPKVAGQHAQHVQAQRIAAGLAQGGELVAGVVTDLEESAGS